jgi:hypothetical protein
MKSLRFAAAGLVSGVMCVAALSAQAPAGIDKAYMGAWKLNVAKSTYENATAPREQVRTHEDRGGGFVLVVQDTVNAQGAKTHSEYVYKPDGKDYPMAAPGQTGIARIALKAVDPLTVTYQQKLDGKVTTDGKRTVSKDGRTMTLDVVGTNAQGQRYHTISVFEKQGAPATTR